MTDAGHVYGQALYGLARDEGISHRILDELTVLRESMTSEPHFLQLLCTPSIPRQERCLILDNALRSRVHPYVLNFLKILTERGYVRQFPGCCDAFRQQFHRDNGILPVTAHTAVPLSGALREQLTEKLSAATGRQIELDCRLDRTLLGGIRLDLEGTRLDGTVRGRLEDIQNMLNQCVL